MGYSVAREGKSFYALFEDKDTPKRRIKKTSEEWNRSGFSSCKTFEDARDWVKILNHQIKDKKREGERLRIVARLESEGIKRCAWLPESLTAQFEQQLRAKKIHPRHWATSKFAILAMGCEPRDWEDNAFKLYDYCKARSWSLDYANTIRRTLNEWGKFYCKKVSNSGYSPIPYPSGTDRNAIMTAYESFRGDRRRSRPSGRLSFKLLEENKTRFSTEEYNWLFLSRAFGLRPEEMEKSLRLTDKYAISKSRKFLHVYQYKMERSELNPLRRWKKIPIKTAEQERALIIITNGNFKKPKTVGLLDARQRVVTHYGGRKDFFPEMAKRYGETEASKWLGHRSVDTARRHYDDPFMNAPGFDDDEEEESAA